MFAKEGLYLHFQQPQSFLQGGDVFHSNVDHKIQIIDSTPISPPNKLYQIFTQFTKNTQNHFDIDFDKTLIFSSKIKLSDNLKQLKIPHFYIPIIKNSQENQPFLELTQYIHHNKIKTHQKYHFTNQIFNHQNP